MGANAYMLVYVWAVLQDLQKCRTSTVPQMKRAHPSDNCMDSERLCIGLLQGEAGHLYEAEATCKIFSSGNTGVHCCHEQKWCTIGHKHRIKQIRILLNVYIS